MHRLAQIETLDLDSLWKQSLVLLRAVYCTVNVTQSHLCPLIFRLRLQKPWHYVVSPSV
jgi:hypothetical protein